MVRASGKDAHWAPPLGGVPGTTIEEETTGEDADVSLCRHYNPIVQLCVLVNGYKLKKCALLNSYSKLLCKLYYAVICICICTVIYGYLLKKCAHYYLHHHFNTLYCVYNVQFFYSHCTYLF